MSKNPTLLMGTILIMTLAICCTALVWHGDINGDTFMAGLVAPIVGGVVGIIGHARGVTQGSDVAAKATEAEKTT